MEAYSPGYWVAAARALDTVLSKNVKNKCFENNKTKEKPTNGLIIVKMIN